MGLAYLGCIFRESSLKSQEVKLNSKTTVCPLREKVGDAFNDISALLGGVRESDTAPRAKTVEPALDFAEASQRFQSRAP
jgi:hypothetical protein